MQVSEILDAIFGVFKTLGSIFGGQQGNSGMDPVLKASEYPSPWVLRFARRISRGDIVVLEKT